MKWALLLPVLALILFTGHWSSGARADEIVLDGRRIGPPPLPQDTSEGGAEAGAVQAIINEYKIWGLNRTLEICFFGGDAPLRALLASAAAEWDDAAPGLALDPGAAPAYRDCIGPDGKPGKSDIRVAFDRKGDWSGDWSQQGTDAAQFNPDQPSMNIGSVREESLDATLKFVTEESLRGTMLHELGHALGLQHEHQSPDSKCEDELLWDDKVYPALAAPPNKWDHAKVDANLRRLFKTGRLRATPYDRKSIMHYSLPADWFRDPSATCRVPENDELSATDLAAIAGLYAKTHKERKDHVARMGGPAVRIANELKLDAAAAQNLEQGIKQALPADLRDVAPRISQCMVTGNITGNSGGVTINMNCNVPPE